MQISLIVGLVVTALALAAAAVSVKATLAIAVVAGVAVFVACFIKPETGLYVLIFSMLLSPEAGDRGTTGGGFTIRADDFLLLIIGFSWFARSAVYKELGVFLKTPLNKPIRYYILSCFISTTWAALMGRVHLSGFFFLVKYIEYFIVYFMVVNYVRSREQIRYYFLAVLATCILVSVIAIAQIPGGERITAPFEGKGGEPNTLGGYLILMLSLVLGVLLTRDASEPLTTKLPLLGLACVLILPLLYTRSRGSWIAAVVVIASFIVLSEKRTKILLACALLTGLIVLLAPRGVEERVTYTFEQQRNPWAAAQQEKFAGITLDTSTSERIRSWRGVLNDFPRHPFLGYGITGWKFLDAQYARVLIETGVIGLLAFSLLVGAIFREVRRVYLGMTGDRFLRGIALGTLVGLIGLLAHSLSANTFIIVRIMEPFWLLVGMVIVMPGLAQEDSAAHVSATFEAGAA